MPGERKGLIVGADGRTRCAWAGASPEYVAYHDLEWGRPVDDGVRLFEKICLEGFQSGLSWLTILRKREHFRKAFAGFDIRRVARYGDREIAQLLGDAGIVRHRGKIESTINNARRAAELAKSGESLARIVWQHEPTPASRPRRLDWTTLRAMAITPESTSLSQELKRRGWSFVGPTTMYALMQSVGVVNDHIEGCFCRPKSEKERRAFTRP